MFALLRNPFSEAPVTDIIAAAGTTSTRGGAVTDEAAAASGSGTGAAVLAAEPAGPSGSGASSSGGAASKSGVSCALPVYDGLPPTWAAELCVT